MRYPVLVLCSGLVLGCNAPQGYSPDLTVRFDCPENVTPALEAAIESFLTEKGFRVANLERVRRQFNRGFFPLEIEAYDNRRWTVHLISFRPPSAVPSNSTKRTYTLGVYSPPPTHHDDVLEKDLIDLITQQLKCEIRSSNRRENKPEAASFYDRMYSLQLSRDHEAEICDKTAKTYDAELCRKVPGAN
jgi:hypothetical protein